MICNQCPRKCNIDRDKTLGRCKSPERFSLSRAALHFWEEPCISGKNGSGAIFFSGCNLGCLFCQNYEISHKNKGVCVSENELAKICDSLVSQGANNINLVNPTHYAVQLAHFLKKYKPSVPVVYNSSGYESAETLRMLDGLVDVYLPDFKYIRADKALRYSNAEDYPEVAMKALDEMYRQRNTAVFDENGIMQSGMIIRHLILPSNTNSSVKLLDYINEHFPKAYVSLMAQYTPCNDLSCAPELERKITAREYDKVVNHALDLGMDKIFVQSRESADEKFIPAFDFTGIIK